MAITGLGIPFEFSQEPKRGCQYLAYLEIIPACFPLLFFDYRTSYEFWRFTILILTPLDLCFLDESFFGSWNLERGRGRGDNAITKNGRDISFTFADGVRDEKDLGEGRII